MLLLEELSIRCPMTNYVAVAADTCMGDALTMHHLHGGYIIKQYDTETLADTLSDLRFQIRKAVQ